MISDTWQGWNFERFVENKQKWIEEIPVVSRGKQISSPPQKERILETHYKHWTKNYCILWQETSHKATDFQKDTIINEWKRIAASKKLCFDCLGILHLESTQNFPKN